MWMNIVNTTLWKIFAFLPYYKIIHAGQVCRRWHDLSLDDLLWKLVLIRHFNIQTPVTLRRGAKSWRQEFIRMIDEVPSVLTDLPDHHRQEASKAVHVSFAHTKNIFSVCYDISGFAIWLASHPCTRLFSVDNDFYDFEDSERISAVNSQFNSTDELLLVYGSDTNCPPYGGKISIYQVGHDNLDEFYLVMWVYTEDVGDVSNLWVTNSTFLTFGGTGRFSRDDNEYHVEVYVTSMEPVDEGHVESGYDEADVGDGDNGEDEINGDVEGYGEERDNEETGGNDVDEEERNAGYEGNAEYFSNTLLCDIYTTDEAEHGKEFGQFIGPIKSQEDDVPYLLVPAGHVSFNVDDVFDRQVNIDWHTGIGLLVKRVDSNEKSFNRFNIEDLESLYISNEHFHRMAILGYGVSPDQKTCYINARPIAISQDNVNSSTLGQNDFNENLQLIPLDLASMTFGSTLTGHKGLPGLSPPWGVCKSLCPNVSRDYVGCGSEVDGGYLWDRHYGCLVSLLKSKHEEHKAVNILEEKLKDDLDDEEDLTLPLKKITLYMDKDHEDKDYTAPCGCGYLMKRGRLPQNEEEEVKTVQRVAMEPVNQNIMVTVGKSGRIKVFRSKKWIRENKLAT